MFDHKRVLPSLRTTIVPNVHYLFKYYTLYKFVYYLNKYKITESINFQVFAVRK